MNSSNESNLPLNLTSSLIIYSFISTFLKSIQHSNIQLNQRHYFLLFSVSMSLVGGVRPVDVTADIVIMIDSSDAIGEENYEKEKRLIKYLARLVNVTSEKSRIAVVVYSGFTVLAGRFDGYKSLDEFDKSVDEIPLLGGSYRRMDLALQSAAQVFNSARKGVSKIAVLLTAGRQVPGGISLGSATKQLRNFNASTLVLAVGQQYSKQELSPVVTATGDLFEFPSFDSLLARAKTIGQAIEDKSGKLMPSKKKHSQSQ